MPNAPTHVHQIPDMINNFCLLPDHDGQVAVPDLDEERP